MDSTINTIIRALNVIRQLEAHMCTLSSCEIHADHEDREGSYIRKCQYVNGSNCLCKL
ncbi:unnamed protein product [Paramecium octaurelia]|uniref:Uncharacterized protein n=1 Tax=Paramecium octaurelia TaxID=43137 RepID=A0A8S1XSY7_PAROT|nr:unnamed protein product [Paramecium octaurelia]